VKELRGWDKISLNVLDKYLTSPMQWEGLDESHAMWKDYVAIKENYPYFNLVLKVGFNGEEYNR